MTPTTKSVLKKLREGRALEPADVDLLVGILIAVEIKNDTEDRFDDGCSDCLWD